jgi:ferric-dicitrate binding protein FerR (iron transport regulator)
MTSIRHGDDRAYRTATAVGVDESSAEHARRRAARWYAWLKSPECTLQDRENFERWCSDATNAAAYVALCGDLAVSPELVAATDEDLGFGPAARVFASPAHLPRLEAEPR